MAFYSLTLQDGGAIDLVAGGNFTGRTRQQELCVLRPSGVIDVLWPDPDTHRIATLARVRGFAGIRALASFRFPGSSKDYLVVGSDSGAIVFLELISATGTFAIAAQHTFGRAGIRRDTAGQLLAVDPRGRAVMIAALDGQRLVYLVSRDAINPKLASPLDCSQRCGVAVTVDIAALDVGFENPLFAVLELSYSNIIFEDRDTTASANVPTTNTHATTTYIANANTTVRIPHKSCVFYEVDLGLNTIVKKLVVDVDLSTTKLIALPGGLDGPGGVLVCSATTMEWIHPDYVTQQPSGTSVTTTNVTTVTSTSSQNTPSLRQAPRILIPRRAEHLAVLEAASKTAASTSAAKKRKRKQQDVEDPREQLEETPFYKANKELKLALGIPKIQDGVFIACSTLHVMKKGFFVLLQTEEGDIFKVTLEYPKPEPGSKIDFKSTEFSLTAKYFDTIAVSTGIHIFKSGFLFSAAEAGSHALYQIDSLGDDDNEQQTITSAITGKLLKTTGPEAVFYFEPRPLRNIHLVEDISLPNSVTDTKIMNLFEEETPQVILTCGQGPRSSMKILRRGLLCSEYAGSQLPGIPRKVWTCKRQAEDQFDSYMIFSFNDATLVLEIGETIEEVNDTGILGSISTIEASLMGENLLVQVTPTNVRSIHTGTKKVAEWKPPRDRRIECANSNGRQLLVALSGGIIVYFEIDDTGALLEVEQLDIRTTVKDIGNKTSIKCLTIGEIPHNRLRSIFAACALSDNSICTLSLDPGTLLKVLSRQKLTFEPVSLILSSLGDITDVNQPTRIFLHVGLRPGILFRITVNHITGELSDTRVRLVGSSPVQLSSIVVQNKRCVLVISSTVWLTFFDNLSASVKSVPIRDCKFGNGCGFDSEQCPQTIVGIDDQQLRIMNIDSFLTGDPFSHESIQLDYTPRKFVVHPQSKSLVVITSDSGILPSKLQRHLGTKYRQHRRTITVTDEDTGNEVAKKETVPMLPSQFGYLASTKSTDVTSKIYVIGTDGLEKTGEEMNLNEEEDENVPSSLYVKCEMELEPNESAISVCIGVFHGRTETFLIVGTVIGLDPELMAASLITAKCYIRVYEISDDGKNLNFVHKTEVDSVPSALSHFQGRLAAGVGNTLRLYDMGKKQLLRRAELKKAVVQRIVSIESQGNRIVVADTQDSISVFQYRPFDNKIFALADDSVPRHVSSFTMVDYNTACGGDRFGNIFMLRVDSSVTDLADKDVAGINVALEKRYLNGAPFRLEKVVEYYAADSVMGVAKTNMIPTGRDVVVFATMLGGVGALVPFGKKEDAEFFQVLEIHMRAQHPSITGRDRMAFRSTIAPVKGCVDGDLCEQFARLNIDVQKSIADVLGRTQREVAKKIEDMRNRAVF